MTNNKPRVLPEKIRKAIEDNDLYCTPKTFNFIAEKYNEIIDYLATQDALATLEEEI